ncbi:MAG: arginase family protein [Rhodopseudomonas sp.]|uniref:arginase family protein n=1 Tax=Rhodopseudomonas sp. TaxID=1078 RepID=UPI00183EB788|nr:arginase family protein [Rhodopseudomonas sp.]NVN84982.1 arginase family protein [Rhodopseudomonas sp.]
MLTVDREIVGFHEVEIDADRISGLRSPRKLAGPSVTVLGVGLGLGASHAGVAFGPAALRSAEIIARLRDGGYDITDCGDLQVLPFTTNSSAFSPGVHHAAELRSWICAISRQSYELARSGSIPIVLGGEHSVSIGTINGVGRYWKQRGRPYFVIWIDAHADMDTPSTSPSGSLAEMAAAVVLSEDGCDDFMADGPALALAPSHLALLGLQWSAPEERQALARRGVIAISLEGVVARQAMAAMDHLLERIAACDGVIHVSIDVSVVRAASAGTRAVSRQHWDQLLAIVGRIGRSGRIVAADLVELNPVLDDCCSQADRAVQLLCTAVGTAGSIRSRIAV